MNILELYRELDRQIPPSLSCDWDHDGLMCCPDPEREVKRLLLTLDVTEEAAIYAAEHGFDAIVSHHPLIFRPLPSIISPKLIGLIQKNIAVMSFHTRLDKLDGGVNTVLADCLGIRNAVPFSDEGIGLIGELPEELSPQCFAGAVKQALGCPYLEAVLTDRSCRRIAVVGGDGKDCLSDAVKAGCDTYVTGSMSYNSLTDAAELGIHVIAAGHYYTENPVLSSLAARIQKLDRGIFCEEFSCNKIQIL